MKTQQTESISAILLKGRNQKLVDNRTTMLKIFNFCKELYDDKLRDGVKIQQILEKVEKKELFGGKMNKRMEKPMSEIEVTSATRSPKEKSAPGPNGLVTLLYQEFEKT